MDIVYIDKCRYEIREQKEVPVWYTGMYRDHFRALFIAELLVPDS
jgi:hypothetical protein